MSQEFNNRMKLIAGFQETLNDYTGSNKPPSELHEQVKLRVDLARAEFLNSRALTSSEQSPSTDAQNALSANAATKARPKILKSEHFGLTNLN